MAYPEQWNSTRHSAKYDPTKPRKPNVMHGYSGLDEFYANQNRNVTAFPAGRSVDRDGTSAQEVATDVRSMGMKINPDGSLSPARTPAQVTGAYNPRQARQQERRQRRLEGTPMSTEPMSTGPVSAQTAVNEAMDEVKTGVDPDVAAHKAMARGIVDAGWGESAVSGSSPKPGGTGGIQPLRAGRRARDQPGYRGGFSKPQQQIQRPDIGSPTATPPRQLPSAAEVSTRAGEMAAERDMQRDMNNNISRTRDAFGNTTRIDSRHGSGSVERLTPEQQAVRPPGMVKDDFGRQVPVSEEVNRMAYNQGTKGLPALPGQPGSNFGMAGLDPSKLRQMSRGGAARRA